MEVEGESNRSALMQQIAELKREAALMCTPSTFAASAKAQRKVNTLEKELESLSKGANEGRTWREKVVQVIKAVKILVSVGLAVALFSSPILIKVTPGVLPAYVSLAPLTPNSKDFSAMGYVTVLPWLFFVNRFSLMIGGGIAHWLWPDSIPKGKVADHVRDNKKDL